MPAYYYLRMGCDPVEKAIRMDSKASAIEAYRTAAQELAQYEQSLEGAIHLAECRDELVDYPDFVLSLGPRGGVRCTAA